MTIRHVSNANRLFKKDLLSHEFKVIPSAAGKKGPQTLSLTEERAAETMPEAVPAEAFAPAFAVAPLVALPQAKGHQAGQGLPRMRLRKPGLLSQKPYTQAKKPEGLAVFLKQ